ncbi:YtoQ family protein [Amylibacter sp.]|nr:YtoQ family protein [Amylibacter sp.]MDB3902396.1 YtoQ family protein [Amylibacter sp.]
MGLKVYLAGEIHTNWREDIAHGCKGLDVEFTAPVTDHDSSDDCGVAIMGPEKDKFWHDNKGAKLNAIRTRKAIEDADIVVVRFGEKYKQWNAAFDAGQAYAMGKSLIIMHQDEHQHPLKEIDAAALAIVKSPLQVSQILKYTLDGSLPK